MERRANSLNIYVYSQEGIMKVTIHSKTETEVVTKTITKLVPVTIMKEVEEVVTVTAPKATGEVMVYPVQYRNYTSTIHIQHAGDKVNRHYGFAFDIPGQTHETDTRTIPSLAGTDQVYYYGALVINGTQAWLLGKNNLVFDVPLHTLPIAV